MKFSLKRISVANFRAVRRQLTLDFSDVPAGLYFIRGENRSGSSRLGSNGAGKSTLFAEAIIWVLTGRTSRSQRPGAEVENRMTKGTTSVEMTFTLDDAETTVTRTRSPNALLLDGRQVEQYEIDQKVPLSDAALRKSILIDQFGQMFLSLKPEAKSQLFTETLELDRWIRAADAAGIRGDELNRSLLAADTKLKSAVATIDEIRDQLDRAIQGEADFEKEVKSLLKSAKESHAASVAAAHAASDALNKARDKLGGRGDRDDKKATDLEDKKTKLRQTDRAVAMWSAKAEAATKELDRLKAARQRYKNSDDTCPECGQRVEPEHIRVKLAELAEEIAEAEANCKELLINAGSLKTNSATLERQVTKLEHELTAYREAQTVVSVAAERSLAADREMHRLKAVVGELKERVNPFSAQCDRLEARVKELKEVKAGAEETIAEINRSLAVAKFWQQGFREIRLQQITDALVELEMAANRNAERLGLDDYRMTFATDRETLRGTVSHGFTVALYTPDSGSTPVSFDSYCGGETQRLQLAATFGLSEVLLERAGISPDFEIIDEPSMHLSPEGIEDLLACLSDRARELDRRIFLIDHNSLSAGSFDGVISVVNDSKRGTYVDDGGPLKVHVSRPERVAA